MHAWAEGANDNIKALVNHAFQTDKEGKINTSRVLGLLRESGVQQMAGFRNSLFQLNLNGSRALQLVRLEVDPASQLIPEISGNRVLLAIRLSRADAEGRLRPMNDSVQLPLTLCA